LSWIEDLQTTYENPDAVTIFSTEKRTHVRPVKHIAILVAANYHFDPDIVTISSLDNLETAKNVHSPRD
jgi:hypothetical protein